MKKVNLLFGIHNHQPVGNFDFVFEDAYNKSYLPFLEVLDQFPDMKIGLHFSGILLDWVGEHHPELITLVSKMVRRGQIEMMTGGHYEPILSIIPENDRIGQINKLSAEVKKLFDYDPVGMWLAERVWEPTLPSSLEKAGGRYTIADDTHFCVQPRCCPRQGAHRTLAPLGRSRGHPGHESRQTYRSAFRGSV